MNFELPLNIVREKNEASYFPIDFRDNFSKLYERFQSQEVAQSVNELLSMAQDLETFELNYPKFIRIIESYGEVGFELVKFLTTAKALLNTLESQRKLVYAENEEKAKLNAWNIGLSNPEEKVTKSVGSFAALSSSKVELALLRISEKYKHLTVEIEFVKFIVDFLENVYKLVETVNINRNFAAKRMESQGA